MNFREGFEGHVNGHVIEDFIRVMRMEIEFSIVVLRVDSIIEDCWSCWFEKEE